MNNTGYHPNDGRARHQWLNLFEIANLDEISVSYRLMKIEGLPQDEYYHKNVNRLSRSLSFQLRCPNSLVTRDGKSYIAIPASVSLPTVEYQLMPHVATLVPDERMHQLHLGELTSRTDECIASNFLRFALQGPLMRNHALWGRGQKYFSKSPLNKGQAQDVADVYPGFNWNLVVAASQRIFVALDVTSCYVERGWFLEQHQGEDPMLYRWRHFLYHFGPAWYTVQLSSTTDQSIREQHFWLEAKGGSVDVYTYTTEMWRENPPPWIEHLDPLSPAILYRYPGNEKESYGALALCKLCLPTSDASVSGQHNRAKPGPAERLERSATVIRRCFQDAQLGGSRIRVNPDPLETEQKVFNVPAQLFGNGHVLKVGQGISAGKNHIVPIKQLGQERKQLLLNTEAGPLDVEPFDAQYIFLPKSLPREINEDYERRFARAMRNISGRDDYSLQRVLYDDKGATSLYRQVQAIKAAVSQNGIDHGYALLVLPERAHRDLHNYIKKDLWPNLQFQCATASAIRSYYIQGQDSKYRPADAQKAGLNNYVMGCALGMMVVNRKWLWALLNPLHYEAYIGIDVLNGVAGLTFVYEHGRKIIFRDYPSTQPEQLTTRQIRQILLDCLKEDVPGLEVPPRNIIVHRDGRSFDSELKGLHAAIDELRGNILLTDSTVGVVDIRKTTSHNLRCFSGYEITQAENPKIGFHIDDLIPNEGVLCTTGWPFGFPGTAKPLRIVVVEGDLNITYVLEDVFALSQLVFTAPNRCMRLPATIKFADDFLEPIASHVDQEEALYDEGPLELTREVDAA